MPRRPAIQTWRSPCPNRNTQTPFEARIRWFAGLRHASSPYDLPAAGVERPSAPSQLPGLHPNIGKPGTANSDRSVGFLWHRSRWLRHACTSQWERPSARHILPFAIMANEYDRVRSERSRPLPLIGAYGDPGRNGLEPKTPLKTTCQIAGRAFAWSPRCPIRPPRQSW